MKQRIIWLPTLIVLICSTMLTGCVSLDKLSEDEFLKEAGITVGILTFVGIISLFKKDDSKKNSSDKNQVEKVNHTISLNNYHKEMEDIKFSSKGINTIKLTGTYTEDSFISFVYSIKNVNKVTLDLSKLKNMEEVPAKVFSGSNNLVKIYLPKTIEKINTEAFYDCENLEQITIPENTKFIGENAFNDCSSLTKITLPNGLEQIAPSTFENCENLLSIELPKSVKSIGSNAFKDCASLEKIKFNSNLAVIGDYSFYKCTALKQISLPDSVTELGREVFANCSSLEKVKLSNKLTQISSSLFINCSSLVSVNIPNSVTEIDSSAFSNCISLKEILIPSSVEKIGSYAFENCTNLTNAKIDGCVEFSGYTFLDCKNLKNVTFPPEIKNLGYDTFKNCTSLKTITIPKTSFSIIGGIFEGCINLEKVIINSDIKECRINGTGFADCKKLKSIELPASLEKIESNSDFYFENVSKDFKFILDSKNSFFSVSTDGKMLTSKDGKTLYAWIGASGDITVPDGLTAIGNNFFSNNKNITSVIIPDSVESVSDNAFVNCTNLTSVVFPKKLKSGEFYSEYHDSTFENEYISLNFSGCENLTSVVLPTNISFVDFSGCKKLEKVVLPASSIGVSVKECANLKSIEFENGVKNLGFTFNTFKGCTNLELIKFPASLEFIGYPHEKYPICFPVLADSPKLKFEVDSNNENFSTADNGKMLTSKDGKTLYAWAGLSGDVTIPKNISIIENSISIFEGYDIKTLTIPEHVIYMGAHSASDSNIEKLVINAKEICLATRVFCDCKNLKSVIINGNLTNNYVSGPGLRGFGHTVFSDCENLESFEFYGKFINYYENTDEVTLSNWFLNCKNLKEISIPKGIKTYDSMFNGCYNLRKIDASKNPNFAVSKDGSMLLSKDKKTLLAYPSASGDVIIPDYITTIGHSALGWNENITSITVPDNVTVIEPGAFDVCKNLKTITLSKNIKKLESMFSYDTVKEINYPGTEEEWNAIEIDKDAKSDFRYVKINFNYRK